MIHAQWGLKDKLFSNPDIWLCHQCSDCTAYCPRGAKPGEVLGAIRKLSIEHYAFPSFMGKALGNPKNLWMLLAVPVVLFATILVYLGTSLDTCTRYCLCKRYGAGSDNRYSLYSHAPCLRFSVSLREL